MVARAGTLVFRLGQLRHHTIGLLLVMRGDLSGD